MWLTELVWINRLAGSGVETEFCPQKSKAGSAAGIQQNRLYPKCKTFPTHLIKRIKKVQNKAGFSISKVVSICICNHLTLGIKIV